MDFAELLMSDHGLHLRMIGLFFALCGVLIGMIGFMFKSLGKQIRETRDDLREVNGDVKAVGKDVVEIKTSMAQFVTRDEYNKGLERVHMRVDSLEKVVLDTRVRLPAKIPERDDFASK